MHVSRSSLLGLLLLASTSLLTACGGSTPLQPGFGVPANGARVAPASRRSSWVAPDAKRDDLLYISDLTDQVVSMYSYPRGRLKGQITGFFNPEGLCVDKSGNVWVVNDTSDGIHQITEYAHGGTTPIANLNDPNGNVNGCSIDPTSGDLAVTSFFGATGNQGSVSIYRGAKGGPVDFVAPNIYYYYYCGYDNKGNLFVDGLATGSAFAFAELPHGSIKFKNVVLNQSILYPGGVQWDGKHMAVGDQYGPIYQFAIRGNRGTEVGVTPLDQEKQIVQFWIQGGRVIGPNEYGANVMLWSYPAGGSPTKTLSGPGIGATVSLARK